MTDKNYNGWTNWDTWNAHLHLTNNEATYNAAIRARDADELREIFLQRHDMDGITPDFVNWQEIYEGLNETDENINTFYRLDEYPGPIGNLIGFYGDLASAIEEAETDGLIKQEDHEPTQYPYLQITEFITIADEPSQYAWEIGTIVNDHFFTYT